MRTPASFHANQLDVYVPREAQQLGARRNFLHTTTSPRRSSADQMKNCLTKINTDGV